MNVFRSISAVLGFLISLLTSSGNSVSMTYTDGAGRNSYDFGARILSSGAWTTPDPLAERFYPLSPYIFCASDPINFIDTGGREVISVVVRGVEATIGYPDNGNMIVFAHGSTESIEYQKIGMTNETIDSASGFINMINKESSDYKNFDKSNRMVIIELMSCYTGKNDENGETFAQKLSKDLKNVIIRAPNGILNVNILTKETKVYDISEATNERTEVKDNPWRFFIMEKKLKAFLNF